MTRTTLVRRARRTDEPRASQVRALAHLSGVCIEEVGRQPGRDNAGG